MGKLRYTAVALLLMVSGALIAQAAPYSSYVYDISGEPVPTPDAYVPLKSIGAVELGVPIGRLEDIAVYADEMYLLDSGRGQIICVDSEYSVTRVIDEFDHDGTRDRLRDPQGLFMSDKGDLYVADTGNQRVVQLTLDGVLVRVIGQPETDGEGLWDDTTRFKPTDLVVDNAGRIYVIAQDIYDGVMEFDSDGNLRGYVGAPRVTPSAADLFWLRLATDEQRQRLSLFLPIEFSSLALDDRGFIYATVPSGSGSEMVKRLNPGGNDVLRRGGFFSPSGDAKYVPVASGYDLPGREGPSVLVDIVPRELGMYSVLDRHRGRVFTYDSNGNLLYVFGGIGDQTGLFRTPVAIDRIRDRLIVVDQATGRATVFEPTEYGRLVHAALAAYSIGSYDSAEKLWREVLRLNSNSDLAYSGIGRALFRQGLYEDALASYHLGNDRKGYSDVLAVYRELVVTERFASAILLLLGIALALFLVKRWGLPLTLSILQNAIPVRRDGLLARAFSAGGRYLHGLGNRLLYAVHVIFHPFDGFWSLKHERRGGLDSAILILALLTVTYLGMRQYTGFLFNTRDASDLNFYVEAGSVIVPFLLWSAVNWSLTTLAEGKGSLADIVVTTAYASVPLILIGIPLTVVSHILTLPEAVFYHLALTVSIAWSVALLLLGTMVLHEYPLVKTIFTSLLTLAGIGFVLFLSLMYVTLLNKVIQLVLNVYTEISFRV